MKTSHILIGVGVAAVVGYYLATRARAARATPGAAIQVGNDYAGFAANPPNGAPPAPPKPLAGLGDMSAELWGLAQRYTASVQPPIGAAVTAAERITAQSLPVPTIY